MSRTAPRSVQPRPPLHSACAPREVVLEAVQQCAAAVHARAHHTHATRKATKMQGATRATVCPHPRQCAGPCMQRA
eukprot:15463034-Alexandrium_andersonii.AAC.1